MYRIYQFHINPFNPINPGSDYLVVPLGLEPRTPRLKAGYIYPVELRNQSVMIDGLEPATSTVSG